MTQHDIPHPASLHFSQVFSPKPAMYRLMEEVKTCKKHFSKVQTLDNSLQGWLNGPKTVFGALASVFGQPFEENVVQLLQALHLDPRRSQNVLFENNWGQHVGEATVAWKMRDNVQIHCTSQPGDANSLLLVLMDHWRFWMLSDPAIVQTALPHLSFKVANRNSQSKLLDPAQAGTTMSWTSRITQNCRKTFGCLTFQSLQSAFCFPVWFVSI